MRLGRGIVRVFAASSPTPMALFSRSKQPWNDWASQEPPTGSSYSLVVADRITVT